MSISRVPVTERVMRSVCVVTCGRSDLGLLLPVMKEIRRSQSLSLLLVATGMHLVREHGLTIHQIEAAGFTVDAQVDMLQAADSEEAIARAIGVGVMGFAGAWARLRPDVLLLLGDRFEILAAAAAALPFAIPIAHIHGGESTTGAFDEAIRHSLTKMSHLHFVSTEIYRRRVVQLGEDPGRVLVTGAPGLDHIAQLDPCSKDELEAFTGLSLAQAPLLVTMHPETLDVGSTAEQVEALVGALEDCGLPVVLTEPNADTCGRMISERLKTFVARHPGSASLVRSLGHQRYLSMLGHVRAMVGNSSSGIIEAASFGLPVVNIGRRQLGRVSGANVVHAPFDRRSICQAISNVCDPSFRDGLQGMSNPYGDGRAAGRIVEALERATYDRDLVAKRFFDIELDETSLVSVSPEP